MENTVKPILFVDPHIRNRDFFQKYVLSSVSNNNQEYQMAYYPEINDCAE